MMTSLDLLRAAVADAEPNYKEVTVDHLGFETPCAGWDLRALLNHAYSRIDLATRAAKSEAVEDFSVVEIDHCGDDPAGAFVRLTAELVSAWETSGDFETPRVTPLGPLPPEGLLLFVSQDIFIHAWDVAKTIGSAPQLSPEMVATFTETHHKSVDENTRAMFFSEEVAVPDDASELDKLVAFLGRQP